MENGQGAGLCLRLGWESFLEGAPFWMRLESQMQVLGAGLAAGEGEEKRGAS